MTKNIARTASLTFALTLLPPCGPPAAAQTAQPARPAREATTQPRVPQAAATETEVQREAGRATADETFELNIGERRITRPGLEASTAVEAGGGEGRGLRVRIGVALGATNIDVLLRNVRGLVRFRGSLERLLRRLNLQPGGAPQPAPPSNPSP